MKQELKPCPFCGGSATIVKQINFFVQCDVCFSGTSISYYEDVVVDAWNTRSHHNDENTNINWEQRRFEIAKDMLCALETRMDIKGYDEKYAYAHSIKLADGLIHQLKQQNNE